jgi:RNA polymerase sigma-70 factor, ECF subfamily
MELLHRLLFRGLRYYALRHCSDYADDLAQQCMLELVGAIRAGQLQQPERLPAYARTIMRRKIAAKIDELVQSRAREVDVEGYQHVRDRRMDPAEQAAASEMSEILRGVLRRMTEADREVLFRFYVDGQNGETIMAVMNLTETQFRLLKWRAKAKFVARARVALGLKKPPARSNDSANAGRFWVATVGKGTGGLA